MTKNIRNLLVLLFCIIMMVPSQANSNVKVSGFNFVDKGLEGKVSIKLEGRLYGEPELTIKKNILQVAIPNSFVWPKIEKNITLKNSFDTKVMAYQYDKNTVRFRALLPYDLTGKEGKVGILLKDKGIEVVFPKAKTRVTAKAPAAPIKKRAVRNKKKAGDYDESYLQKLLSDKKNYKGLPTRKIAEKPLQLLGAKKPAKTDKKTTDEVSMALAAGEKSPKSSFSLTSYIGKFVAFLAVVLLLFYGVVNLMRKGALKKGKLGFLNSTKAVEVLNTTYVGPKRSILMVRAHNQVFLVGSSEAGLQPLGEISDTTGLMKEGEKALAGTNFDTNLGSAETTPKEFKLKENIEQSAESNDSIVAKLASSLDQEPVEDKVKLSDQIKSKVKGLKSLQ